MERDEGRTVRGRRGLQLPFITLLGPIDITDWYSAPMPLSKGPTDRHEGGLTQLPTSALRRTRLIHRDVEHAELKIVSVEHSFVNLMRFRNTEDRVQQLELCAVFRPEKCVPRFFFFFFPLSFDERVVRSS